ncbi:MAG: vitamin K epoxide reductase family protein, partial [Bacteroidota bacterium]
MEKLITELLYSSNIFSIEENDFNLQLLSHSEYPSLKAVTDTLDYFGVENIAANVPKDALRQLPDYFLAIVDTGPHQELALVRKKKEKILLNTQAGKKKKYSAQDFKSKWNGTIIAIEKETEKEKPLKRMVNMKLIATLVIIAMSLTVLIISNTTIPLLFHFALSLIGTGVSYSVLKEDLGVKDEVTAKVCGVISKKTDGCSAVIQSRAGKLPFGIGLGDISMVFFVSMICLTFFTGFHNSLLYAISILSIPFILFSYYVQAITLKQWCLLCLIISAVLISQFVVLQIAFTGWDFSLPYILKAFALFSSTAVIWSFIKKLWADSLELPGTTR